MKNFNQMCFTLFLKKNIYFEPFLNSIYEISQSNQMFLLNGKLNITIRIIKSIQGSGFKRGRNLQPTTFNEASIRKRSVVVIKNSSNSCGYLALFLRSFLSEKSRRDRKKIGLMKNE